MPEKFTVEQKEQIVIESFTATNIAELCRKHGVSVAQFHRWKERFLEGGRKGLGESSKSSRRNEYQKEIDDLKRLVGDQDLAIDALKKIYGGGDNGCC
jgi:putative transposase